MAPAYDILLHQLFLRELDEIAPPRSRLRQQVNDILHEASLNPRGPGFGKLWSVYYFPCEIVTWRAPVGARGGHRLINGLFQDPEAWSVEVVPVLLSDSRRDEGFRYVYRQVQDRVLQIALDYVNPQRPRFSLWDGTL